MPRPLTLRQLAAAFDAQIMPATAARSPQTCPRCLGQAQPTRTGGQALCRACTLTELGVTEYVLALMCEFHQSARQIHARLERDGTPAHNPRAWLTPRRKLRTR